MSRNDSSDLSASEEEKPNENSPSENNLDENNQPEIIEMEEDVFVDSDKNGSDKNEPPKNDPRNPNSFTNFPNFSSQSNSSNDSFTNLINGLAPIITPLLTAYLSSSMASGFANHKKECPVNDIISSFTGLWEGLNEIENKKLRAICFMNNLNKFHDHVSTYVNKHVPEKNQTLVTTTLNLAGEKLRREIINVMEQLNSS